MKILIDEDLDVRLRHLFPHYDAYTVEYMGWKGLSPVAFQPLGRSLHLQLHMASFTSSTNSRSRWSHLLDHSSK